MTLPALELPKIDLPFDIPILMHPPIDHFAIALPVIILLLEFYNLFARRKSIGAFSFGLLVLTVVVFAAAYLSGSIDGKEAYNLLSPEGQEELKAHKLLGTYLLVGSVVVLFFKLLAMTGKFYFKFFFFVVLLGFIAITFKQGKDGGELVYEFGANIERVTELKDELSEAKEEVIEAQEALEKNKKEAIKKVETVITKPTPVVEKPVAVPTPTKVKVDTLTEEAKKEIKKSNEKVIETLIDTAKDNEKKALEVVPMENTEIH